MAMTIEKIQEGIIEEFDLLEDWMDKYEYLIELGKELPLIDDEHRTDDNLIRGCQSRVWLHPELKDGKVLFSADSDAIITKGLISLLLRVFSNQEPDAIANASIEFIDKIGLSEYLSPTRSNGLLSMVKQIKLYAVAFRAKV